MGHKCPMNEPENRLFIPPGRKGLLSQPLTMSHDETFMSHHETSHACGNAPEIRRKIENRPGKSEMRPEIRKPARNCLSAAPASPRFGLAPAIARGKIAELRAWAASGFSCRCRPAPAFGPGTQGFRGLRRGRSGCRVATEFRRLFPPSRRAPAPTPAGDVPHGTFMSHQRTQLRRNEPERFAALPAMTRSARQVEAQGPAEAKRTRESFNVAF